MSVGMESHVKPASTEALHLLLPQTDARLWAGARTGTEPRSESLSLGRGQILYATRQHVDRTWNPEECSLNLRRRKRWQRRRSDKALIHRGLEILPPEGEGLFERCPAEEEGGGETRCLEQRGRYPSMRGEVVVEGDRHGELLASSTSSYGPEQLGRGDDPVRTAQ